MSWPGISQELREVIERACTPKQIRVVQLRAQNLSFREIGRALDINERTVRDHWAAATQNIRREVAATRGVQ